MSEQHDQFSCIIWVCVTDSRKLFGGYKITPRFCKPTRQVETNLGGPNICMFNHECALRNGQVVGACMDGFLFGACCQLPVGVVGELIESDLHAVGNLDNNMHYKPPTRSPQPTLHPTVSQITLNGISQISESLLKDEVLPTAQDNAVVDVGGVHDQFSTTGVTHPTAPDTFILNQEGNEINPAEFKRPSSPMPIPEDRRTTTRIEQTTPPYRPVSPFIQISISNAPDFFSTPKPIIGHRPGFRPKPSRPSTNDHFVLVPTISHTVKPGTPQEFDSIANIIQMLNQSSTTTSYANSGTYPYSIITTRKPPSTSYVFRPDTSTTIVTKKTPSTSYVYSSTPLPSRPGYNPELTTTTKRKPARRPTSKPTKKPTTKPTSSLYFYPDTSTNSYIYSSTSRPAHSTFANSPDAFVTTSKRPPSTSYVYSSTFSKKPTVTTSTVNPSYTVYPTSFVPSSNSNSGYTSSSSRPNLASPPPTIIILGPSTEQPIPTQSTHLGRPTPTRRKPVAQVTINNHVTHNVYSTQRPGPAPTVLITPKPSLSSPQPLRPTPDYLYTAPVEIETSVNDLINFPPVRNPNLNISAFEDDFTTPAFLEDEALNIKMESFVNKIVQSLQEPFQGLKDVVYNKNTTVFLETTSKAPTRKPPKSTTKPVASTNAKPTSSRKPTTKRPPTTLTSRKPTTFSKKPTPPKRTTTTPQSYLETEVPATLNNDYRQVCGIRPLLKTGRVVGGKAAAFGEFPWQVLVRESTWLGLFTKNKCGGVLISNRYVMTAAHCQPGFLASLVAVLGEHDISGEREVKRSLSRNVKRVVVHRQYDAATFENDLALLELEHPVQFDEHIVPICLPREGEDFTGRMATVTGWGRLKYGGGIPSILQEVQVPIMENQVCQEMFRTAGHNKKILESFLCAGYANGQKDSCE
ncbi:hypothetical protein ILUMI_01311, partial [Ignelater luminosus]